MRSGIGLHSAYKHVAAVCLMLTDFSENGILKIAKTTTKNLMSFNRSNSSHLYILINQKEYFVILIIFV